MRHATIALLAGLLAYAALLIGSITLLSGDAIEGTLPRALVALLPVPAGVALVGITIRQFLAADELQQRLQLIGLAVSFLGTLLVVFSWGFLEGVGVAAPSGFVIFGILVGLYLVGLFAARRRYR